MAKIDALNSFLMDRFSSIAGEILQFVEAIVLEQQDEIKRTKEENRNLMNMLAEAGVNKENSGADPQISFSEGSPVDQQSCCYEALDDSLIRVKLELSTLQPEPEPQQLTEAPADVAPHLKKTSAEKQPQRFSTKTKQSEDLQMNSYLTINLVPCDAQLIPDKNSNSVSTESASDDCDKGVKESLHSCPHCKESFTEFSMLMSHLDSHEGALSPFYCHTCGRYFKNRVTLKNHMIVHQKLRRFRCNFCGKGFHQKGHLKEHERIHTGEKPYSCSLCGKCFTQFNHVRGHVRNHHQDTIHQLETSQKKR